MFNRTFEKQIKTIVIVVFWMCLSFAQLGLAQATKRTHFFYSGKSYKTGDTVFGFKGYVKLLVGDETCPLILGVPHDGTAKGNPEIPETGTVGRDLNTLALATEIARHFKKKTNLQPWIIINTIARKRVDPNTYPDDLPKRYQDNEARSTYLCYHALLHAARAKVSDNLPKEKHALFLDLHGHAHRYVNEQEYHSIIDGKQLTSRFINQIELGYALSKYALMQADDYLDKVADSSSIAALAQQHQEVPFSELIRGPYSFGALLEDEKLPAVPSNKIRKLEYDAAKFGLDQSGLPNSRPYFNGGYCTRRYGTTKQGQVTGFNDRVSSIQAETPGITVRNNKAIIDAASQRFNRAIIIYLNKWFGYSFRL